MEKAKRMLTLLLWVLIGLWYIPVLFAGYGQEPNCGGVLPDGTPWTGFCSAQYFRTQWWLVALRAACIAFAIAVLVRIKRSARGPLLFPYAVFAFLSLSTVLLHLGEPRELPFAAMAGILFFGFLSLPWWGSRAVVALVKSKMKPLR